MNLSDTLPEIADNRVLWLHGEYGDPKRANFWDLRAVLAELTPEQLTEIVEAAGALHGGRTVAMKANLTAPGILLPQLGTHTLWLHDGRMRPMRATFWDLRAVLAELKPERLAEIVESARALPRASGGSVGLTPGPGACMVCGGVLGHDDRINCAACKEISVSLATKEEEAKVRQVTIAERLKRSKFARSRTKRRLDQLASALGRLAAFANVSHTVEREALKGEVRPSDVAEWIEQALTSDWKIVFKLTGAENIPDAIKAIRSNVTARREYVRGQTEMQERAASEADKENAQWIAKHIRQLPLAIKYDSPGPVANVSHTLEREEVRPSDWKPRCGHCRGSGIVAENEYQSGPCPECGGAGYVEKAEAPLRLGVAVILWRDGEMLMQLRRGAHGAGTWSFPGGHVEDGESPAEAASRELKEETGIEVPAEGLGVQTFTSDVFEVEGKRYVTLYFRADCPPGSEPEVREPEKCAGMKWVTPGDWPGELFLPAQNFFKHSMANVYVAQGGKEEGFAKAALDLVNEARSLFFDAQVLGHTAGANHTQLDKKIDSWCERAQALDILHGAPGGNKDSGDSGAAQATPSDVTQNSAGQVTPPEPAGSNPLRTLAALGETLKKPIDLCPRCGGMRTVGAGYVVGGVRELGQVGGGVHEPRIPCPDCAPKTPVELETPPWTAMVSRTDVAEMIAAERGRLIAAMEKVLALQAEYNARSAEMIKLPLAEQDWASLKCPDLISVLVDELRKAGA